MGLDIKTLAIAKKYTKESLQGSGAVQGKPGKDGIGISAIDKISVNGLIDTYQITLSNGNTYDFTVTNGKDGMNPSISVGNNDNWIINGIDTGISAKGIKGDTGTGFKIEKQYNSIDEMMCDTNPVEESVMVVVINNDTGFLYLRLPSYNDPKGETNGYLPFGSLTDVSVVKGEKGDNGITPHIDPATNHWFLGKTDTGVKATGEKGNNGKEGSTPKIDSNTKHWMIGEIDTGIIAEGAPGEKGDNGDTPHIGENGNWYTGNTDTGIKAVIDPTDYTDEKYGIQDTPVGHVISHIGTISPKHYLICDGSEYNINDYPYLVEHFILNFGESNYFGGDGTTTFAVPDLRGEFLRGTGTADRNSGSGSNVGVHQEPTWMPNVIADGDAIEHVSATTSDDGKGEPKNIDKSIKNYTTQYVISSKEGLWTQGYNKRNHHYTSRPTNTSVLYCIKYEPTYFITVNNNTDFIDFSDEIVPASGITIKGKSACVQNNIVSIFINVRFPVAGASFFATIPKKYAPKNTTLGISYAEEEVSDAGKVTFAAAYSSGSIYSFCSSKISGSYAYNFIYPLNTNQQE